jgi:hypothetical protein
MGWKGGQRYPSYLARNWMLVTLSCECALELLDGASEVARG